LCQAGARHRPEKEGSMKRRSLLKGIGLAALPAAAQSGSSSPSGRIGVGVIGCGGQGSSDQRGFQVQPDAEIVAVCDVYKPNMERARQAAGGKAAMYSDFRKLLEENVQAVVIATPEHWHAYMCI